MIDLFELINHTDQFIIHLINQNIWLTYFVLFLIIFLESGIILFPFLPGDGFLFSVGVVCTFTSLSILIVIPLLIFAAVIGFIVNYHLGSYFGIYALQKQNKIFLSAYNSSGDFMTKHGKKAVILARFFPIVRTFLPFVAGFVQMNKKIFIEKTVLGAVVWVCSFCLLGYFTGNIPWVQKNYGLIFLGLIIVTILPFIFKLYKYSFNQTK